MRQEILEKFESSDGDVLLCKLSAYRSADRPAGQVNSGMSNALRKAFRIPH
jgi:hypothetical protein